MLVQPWSIIVCCCAYLHVHVFGIEKAVVQFVEHMLIVAFVSRHITQAVLHETYPISLEKRKCDDFSYA